MIDNIAKSITKKIYSFYYFGFWGFYFSAGDLCYDK